MHSYLVFHSKFVWDQPDTTGTLYWLNKEAGLMLPWQPDSGAVVAINGVPVGTGQILSLVKGQTYEASPSPYIGVVRYISRTGGVKVNGYLTAPLPDSLQVRPVGLVKKVKTSYGQAVFHWIRNADTQELTLGWEKLTPEQVSSILLAFLNSPDTPELLEVGNRTYFLAGIPDISVDGSEGYFNLELSGMVNTYLVGGGVS